MKRVTSLVCLSLALLASVAMAAQVTRTPSGDIIWPTVPQNSQLGASTNGKAAVDTTFLLGGLGTNIGKFQDVTGTLPDRQGWIGYDWTVFSSSYWHISTFNAALLDPSFSPNHAMYCGDVFTSCGPGDPDEGYGNGWIVWLDWYGTATNMTSTNVTVTARLNYDVEFNYDFVGLQVERSTGMVNTQTQYYTGVNKPAGFQTWTDPFVPVDVNIAISVPAADYVGPSNDQIHLRWRVYADTGYSDQDCGNGGFGACQVDNIEVMFDGVSVGGVENFEPGHTPSWTPALPPACGDFSKVWPRLADADPCNINNTPQFAFIDDGEVVEGTGGSLGISWTYGPGGYIHNLTGGLAGPEFHMNNDIWSPAIAWPTTPGYDGLLMEFDVYAHLPRANGMYYSWNIRSSDDGGATWSIWAGPGFVYYAAVPAYGRFAVDVSGFVLPGRTHMQLALTCIEYGYVWGNEGIDGTPSPYFDNVRLTTFSYSAPNFRNPRDIDFFNSGFPAIGVIDYTTAGLGNNSIRVDAAQNISNQTDLRNDPGDSMFTTIAPVRAGAVFVGLPEMHVRMKANPLFDGVRTLPAGFTKVGQIIEGTVLADTTYTRPIPTPILNRWNWDLPDTGFFFPGDVFHYYLKAQDVVGADVGTALLPADTSGFAYFPGDPGHQSLRFPSNQKVRGLPSMPDTIQAHQPQILWWNDNENRGFENEWFGALDQLGYREGIDYDVYYNNGCSSGVGNGLGGRASETQLAGYQTLLYDCGTLQDYLIANGDYNEDPSRDVQVLEAWFALGNKNAFFSGEDLAYNMQTAYSGPLTAAFMLDRMGITYNGGDVRTYIGNQATPWVKPVTGNTPGLTVDYVAFGGCQVINDFDRYRANTAAGASMIMQWTSPTGATGYSTYAAAVYNPGADGCRVISMPYDFGLVFDKATHTGGQPIRNVLLGQILTFFGNLPSGSTTVDVPNNGKFFAKNYPNPFNPLTKIEFNLPRDGQVELKVFNVRGELVRTLVNEFRTAKTYVEQWDGKDSNNRSVASGVYFYSLKAAGEQKIEKMTLVK